MREYLKTKSCICLLDLGKKVVIAVTGKHGDLVAERSFWFDKYLMLMWRKVCPL